MLFFGTGEKFPVTTTSATSYSTSQQSFYGIWDWNMSGWNANNTSPFVSLSTDPPGTLTPANLQEQLVTYDASSQEPSIEQAYLVCYAGSTDCNTTTLGDQESSTSSNNQYGWYIDFPGTSSGYGAETYEQEIYNPVLVGSDIQFNSILPAIDSPLMCTTDQNEGWSYALNVQNGTPSSGFWGTSATLNNGNTTTLNGTTIAVQLNASGSSSVVTAQGTSTSGGSGSSSSTTFTNTDLIFQSMNGGPGAPQQVTPGANVTGYRESWIQLR